jgi:hypothetical protein
MDGPNTFRPHRAIFAKGGGVTFNPPVNFAGRNEPVTKKEMWEKSIVDFQLVVVPMQSRLAKLEDLCGKLEERCQALEVEVELLRKGVHRE